MSAPETSRTAIHFHGFELDIDSNDPTIVQAIARRFAAFKAADPVTGVLRFVIRSVAVGSVPRAAPRGRVVYESSRGRAYWYDDDVRIELESSAGHAVCRPGESVAEITIAGESEDAVWTASRPLFTLTLAELLKERGLYFLHAGGVEVEGGAVLVPGNTGVGKSTLTAALAAHGYPLLGDDTVFLDARSGGAVRIRSFPDELDLADHSLDLLELTEAPRSRLAGTEKWQVPVDAAGFAVGAEALPPRLLVFPVRANGPPALEELPVEEALFELLPNVLLTTTERTERHVALLAQLAGAAPAHRLRVGADLDAATRLIRTLI